MGQGLKHFYQFDFFCHSNYIIVTITIQPDEALAKALEHLASEDWEKNVDGELSINFTSESLLWPPEGALLVTIAPQINP